MKYFSWLVLLFIHGELFSQQPLYSNIERYGVENGLPQNLVSGIIQDDDGFIWISTLDGLSRFDGKNFKTFRHNPSDSTTISYNSIFHLHKDHNNNLWINFVSGGYNMINPKTFHVSKPKKIVIEDNTIVFPEYLFIKNERTFVGPRNNFNTHYTIKLGLNNTIHLINDSSYYILHSFIEKARPPKKMVIVALSIDFKEKLWVLKENGIEISDKNGNTLKSFDLPEELQKEIQTSLYNINAPKFFHLGDGRIAIFINNKIITLNPNDGKFKVIVVPNQHIGILDISNSTSDNQGRMVFAYQNHIYRLEDNDTLTLLYIYPKALSIRSLFIDKTNNLWFGTDPDGLYKIDLMKPHFRSIPYEDNFISDVLVNEIGISRKEMDKNIYSVESPYILNSANPERGSLIFSGNGDIVKIVNQKIQSIKKMDRNIVISNSLQGHIAFYDGLNLYDWKNLQQSPEIIETNLPSNSIVNALLIDSDENFWISTVIRGIYHYKKDSLVSIIKPYENYSTNVLSMDPSQENILWIGTVTGGLYKWDKQQEKLLKSYTMENGLPNNTINCIVLDSLGFMWMSTNNGISRFNPEKETFTNYSLKDGIIESEFNRHHAMMLPDGRIAMGGTKGYSIFDPMEFGEDNFSPEVFITHVTVNNIPIDQRIDSTLLPVPINQLEEIKLSYLENTIDFNVATLQFNDVEKIKYRYMLKGYDRNWVETKHDEPIRFTQLPYGKYTLMLNATNTIGVWSPKVRRLAIIVLPPIWLTWWAYSIYGIVVIVFLRLYWLRYRKKVIARQEIQFNLREAIRFRELDETKTRFFSNITHEFRTPLTLILSPLEKYLQDESISPKVQTLLKNNYRHANQLLKLVNQLLDITKLESGQMPLTLTAGDLVFYVQQQINRFLLHAVEKNIALQFTNKNISGYYLFDHEKCEKIISNLLSNAVKFTPENGSIEIILSEKMGSTEGKTWMQFQIKDSGIGIAPDKIEKVFDRFYQVDDSETRAHEGTGIGLSLVKELVSLLGGTINVTSTSGQGSVFTLEMPMERLKEAPVAEEVTSINNYHLPEEEMVPGLEHETPLILVVEDNDDLRKFVKETLASNWNVLEASNGTDGWTIIERELPEIVISDIMMPGLNGYELCDKMKKDPRTSHINFILLTAKATQEAKIAGLQTGADAYITKPFHIHEIELKIRNLLLEQERTRKYLQEKLLSTSPNMPSVSDIFIIKLQNYLDIHLDNSKLKVETIAEDLDMSKSTLNRKLKALLNISINDYLKQYRLQKAAQMLRNGYAVSTIAYQVGFETPSYFSQCFKEHFKETPSSFNKGKKDFKID